MNNRQLGKGIRYLGWFVVAYYLVKYGYAFLDMNADPSVSAYALLVLAEGIFFACSGLFFVWLGGYVGKQEDKPQDKRPAAEETD